jgi:hypothetical protein
MHAADSRLQRQTPASERGEGLMQHVHATEPHSGAVLAHLAGESRSDWLSRDGQRQDPRVRASRAAPDLAAMGRQAAQMAATDGRQSQSQCE